MRILAGIYQYLFGHNIHSWLPWEDSPSHFNACKLFRVKQINRQTLRPDWHVKQLSGSQILWQCSLNDVDKPCLQGLLYTGDSLAHAGQTCWQSHRPGNLECQAILGITEASFGVRGKLHFKFLSLQEIRSDWFNSEVGTGWLLTEQAGWCGQQPHCSQFHRQYTQLPANLQSWKREQLSLACMPSFSQVGS